MSFKRIRAGSGLGDSIYLQSIVQHLLKNGEALEVCTNYPDVFLPLKCDLLKISPFSRENVQIIAHYTKRKTLATKQFDDSCHEAGIGLRKVQLHLNWKNEKDIFTKILKESDRPKLAVLNYRYPMDRADGFAKELLPKIEVFNSVLKKLNTKYDIVLVGKGEALQNYENVDFDFSNKTTLNELINIVSSCDAVFSYCSFMVPLAESLNKKSLFCWSGAGLKSQTQYINTITPKKILFKDNPYIVDTWHNDSIEETVNDFLR